MMYKRRLCFVSLFLCAVTLSLLLSACNQSSGKTEQTQGTTAAATGDTPDPGSTVDLYRDKKMDYSIVYPASADKDLTASVNYFFVKIKSALTEAPVCGTDSKVTSAGTGEILIGDTNRPLSDQVKNELEGESYCIRMIDGNIVICAKRAWMLPDAVEAFMKEINYSKDRSSATLPGDLNLTYTYDGYTRDRWNLKFPAYVGGMLAESTYSENYGYASVSASDSSHYKVTLASKTNLTEFDEYVQTLKKEGYEVTQVNAAGEITAYRVAKGDDGMYMYLSKKIGEARFVLDQNEGVLPQEFSYTYEKKEQDSTVLYLYGLRMDANGINVGEKYPDGSVNTAAYNCGQMLVMKLADNSVMIIDGGAQGQMSKEAAVELNSFLHEITGIPAGEKVRISNWIITHCHIDHFGGFARFLIAYHGQYDLERMCFNFNFRDSNLEPLVKNYLNNYYPNLIYYRPHTGETVTLADIEMNFLYTYEDILSAETGNLMSNDQNDSSLVVKITFDGKSFLLLGDMYYAAEKALLNNYSKEILKSDILQVSHHGWNNVVQLYEAVRPSISLYPQSAGGAEKGLGGYANTILQNVIKYTDGGKNNIYFAGNQTVGIAVVDGKVTVVDTRNVVGTDYDGQWGVFDPMSD